MIPLKKFLNSDYFIATMYIITVLSWVLRLQTYTIILSVFIYILIVITDANRINVVTLIMAGVINYRIAKFDNNSILLLVSVIIGLPFLIYDLFKEKPKFKDEVLLSMIFLLASGALSLINTNKDNITLAITGLIGFIAFVIVYFYLFNKSKQGDFRYVAKNVLALGLAIAVEYFIYIYKYEGYTIGKDIDLGWAISNHIAILYLTIIPITFYLYIEDQKRLFILFAIVVDLIVLLLMLSKAAYVTLAIIVIPFTIISFKDCTNKKRFITDLLVSVAIFIISAYLIMQVDVVNVGLKEYLKQMYNRGWFKDNSRIEIYKIGLKVFSKYPIFGGGLYTANYFLTPEGYNLMNYHNYIIHALATTGILGLVMFLNYLYRIVIKIFKNLNFYNICVLTVISSLLIHGLFDTAWFNPVIMMFLSIYVSTIPSKNVIDNSLQLINNN